MIILRSILMAVEVICSVLLIAVILLQKSKSEGLGLAFGAGVGESLFGSRAGNVLTRITVVLSTVFLLNTLGLAVIFSGARARSLMHRYAAPQARPAGVPPPTGTRPVKEPGGVPTLPGADIGGEAAPAAQPAQTESGSAAGPASGGGAKQP